MFVRPLKIEESKLLTVVVDPGKGDDGNIIDSSDHVVALVKFNLVGNHPGATRKEGGGT